MDWSSGSDCIMPLLMGIGLSACAGIRAWLPMLLVSALAHFGYLELNDSLAILGDIHVLAALVVATAVEIVGDKIPALDNLLDSIGTVLRPAAGTVVSSSLMIGMDGGVAILLGLFVGGGTALSVHTGKSALRLASTASAPVHGGLGNVVLSFIEDVMSVVAAIMAVLLPWLAAMLAISVVVCSIYCIYRWRKRRNLKLAGPEVA